MSVNTAINGVIALIEGRTDVAKELFRSPNSDVKNIPEVMARLDQAVAKAAASYIRKGLVKSLAVQPFKEGEEYEEGFFAGANAVEFVLQRVVKELDPE